MHPNRDFHGLRLNVAHRVAAAASRPTTVDLVVVERERVDRVAGCLLQSRGYGAGLKSGSQRAAKSAADTIRDPIARSRCKSLSPVTSSSSL